MARRVKQAQAGVLSRLIQDQGSTNTRTPPDGRRSGAHSCRFGNLANDSDQEGRIQDIAGDENARVLTPNRLAATLTQWRYLVCQRRSRRAGSDHGDDINIKFGFRCTNELLTRLTGASAARFTVHRHLALVMILHAAGHLSRGDHIAGAGRGCAHTEHGCERQHYESVRTPPFRHRSIPARDVVAVKSNGTR